MIRGDKVGDRLDFRLGVSDCHGDACSLHHSHVVGAVPGCHHFRTVYSKQSAHLPQRLRLAGCRAADFQVVIEGAGNGDIRQGLQPNLHPGLFGQILEVDVDILESFLVVQHELIEVIHRMPRVQNVIDAAEALPGLFHLPVVPAFYIRNSVNKGLQHIIERFEHLNSRLHCVGRDAVLVESLSLMQVRNTGAVRSKHVSHRIEFEDLLRQGAERPTRGDDDIHTLIGRRLQGFPVSFA